MLAAHEHQAPEGHHSSKSIRPSVINLSKNIICGGFLSLPAGVACCARIPTARTLIPATALLCIMGALSAYCFGLIGRACALLREPTYDSAWARAMGSGSRWLVKSSLTCKTFFTCLSCNAAPTGRRSPRRVPVLVLRSALTGAGRACRQTR